MKLAAEAHFLFERRTADSRQKDTQCVGVSRACGKDPACAALENTFTSCSIQ